MITLGTAKGWCAMIWSDGATTRWWFHEIGTGPGSKTTCGSAFASGTGAGTGEAPV